jgi:ferrous iron transport protein B
MSACCDTPQFTPPAASPNSGSLKTVALIGPPNSGKSTLFNRLTGLRQKVANYPGVTVEQRMGLMSGVGRDDLTLIDLPGIYSLTPYSEDARVAVDVLRGKMPGTPKPDAVLLVLDALHLTRQLMLAAPVLAVGLPTLVLLNMSDLMETRGGHIDTLKLARELGAPVALISATHRTGLEAVPLFLNQQTERSAAAPLALPVIGNAASTHLWAAQISRRTGYQAPLSVENTRKIDNILLHRIWGPLLFLAVVIGVFEVVFAIGQPLSDGFGDILARAADLIRPFLPAGWIQSLLLDGAWKGISSVLVFLPQILLLLGFWKTPATWPAPR